MNIKSLKLINFRNYSTLDVEFAKNFNIIYGDNAQGKTNILEAIFLCSSGRSHRVSKDNELIKMGQNGYYIKLFIEKDETATDVEISYEADGKKKIKVNEIPLKKIGNLMGKLNTVLFSPEDLQIIKEGPSERRRFMDITISQLKPSYFYDLQQYLKALAQRNSLLKEIQRNKSLLETLEIWNNNLASLGARIIKVRKEYIERLSDISGKNHKKLTNGNETLQIEYMPSVKVSDFSSTSEIEKSFLANLECISKKELIMNTTLIGPQRDDYVFYLNDINVKSYGSQGQQRTVVLSIKMSEIDMAKEETGEYPVVLLDDVMSELDNKRQEYLFNSLKNVQTIITCTSKEFFECKTLPESYFIKIKGGKVII